MKTPRNADDGDAIAGSNYEIGNSHGNAGEKNPEDVRDEARGTSAVFDRLAEGDESEGCHLESLTPKRNSHDCDVEDRSDQPPTDRSNETAEDDPDYVEKSPHVRSVRSLLKDKAKTLVFEFGRTRILRMFPNGYFPLFYYPILQKVS